MSVTYPVEPNPSYGDRIDASRVDLSHEQPFVPVYARRGKARGGQGRIRTWMILTPVAAVVLGGIGAMLVMQGPEETAAPLVEPARTGPVLSATASEAAAAALTPASTPAPVVAEAPVVRDAAPLRPAAPAPVRREVSRAPATTPASRAAAPSTETPAPVVPTGPQPYAPSPSTATLNTAPMTAAPATPAPTAPPPIIVEPVG